MGLSNFEKNINEIIKNFKIKGRFLFNENLAKYTWFQVGGNANLVFKPKSLEDLEKFLKNIDKKIPITIIGGGSNLLIRDGGINGIVIIIKDVFNNITLQEDYIEVDGGVLNSKIYNFAKNNEIGGLEFLGSIPGTIAGAVRGNAGCYGGEIKDILIEVETIDFDGNIKTFKNEECNFEYRKNNLNNDLIFTKVKLKNDIKKSKEEIEECFKVMIEKRNASQPIGEKTAGSTFKNPAEMPAWKVVKELGYQDKDINGAKMSEKHANFMVNTGKAKAKDLEKLANMIILDAKEKMNIALELEVKIIGKDK